jgi:hypothetical protein
MHGVAPYGSARTPLRQMLIVELPGPITNRTPCFANPSTCRISPAAPPNRQLKPIRHLQQIRLRGQDLPEIRHWQPCNKRFATPRKEPTS